MDKLGDTQTTKLWPGDSIEYTFTDPTTGEVRVERAEACKAPIRYVLQMAWRHATGYHKRYQRKMMQ